MSAVADVCGVTSPCAQPGGPCVGVCTNTAQRHVPDQGLKQEGDKAPEIPGGSGRRDALAIGAGPCTQSRSSRLRELVRKRVRLRDSDVIGADARCCGVRREHLPRQLYLLGAHSLPTLPALLSAPNPPAGTGTRFKAWDLGNASSSSSLRQPRHAVTWAGTSPQPPASRAAPVESRGAPGASGFLGEGAQGRRSGKVATADQRGPKRSKWGAAAVPGHPGLWPRSGQELRAFSGTGLLLAALTT